jgi:hypothetical protein
MAATSPSRSACAARTLDLMTIPIFFVGRAIARVSGRTISYKERRQVIAELELLIHELRARARKGWA